MKKVYLWPNKAPKLEKEKKELKKQLDDNIVKLHKVSNPLIEVYTPKDDTNNSIGILICPGGGYKLLAIDLEGSEVALWLKKLGYTAYVLKYRVPDNSELAFDDMQRSIRMIRNKFTHSKIGVLGFSAGGNLCARLSTNFSKLSYTYVDEIDLSSCKPDFSMLIYLAYLDNGEGYSVSSNLLYDKDIPPTFIFGTEDDLHFNSTLVYAKYLDDLEVLYGLNTLLDGGHGYGLRKGNIAAERWPLLAERWLVNVINKNE